MVTKARLLNRNRGGRLQIRYNGSEITETNLSKKYK